MALMSFHEALAARLAVSGASLDKGEWVDVPALQNADSVEFVTVLARQAEAIAHAAPPLRGAVDPDPSYVSFCRRVAESELPDDESRARRWLMSRFKPCRITTAAPGGMGFLTGYYQPEVPGTLTPLNKASTPLRARPVDLVTLPIGTSLEGVAPQLAAARRNADGTLSPYPTRREIESRPPATGEALVYVADRAEAFLIQVQGSARVVLPDGRRLRMTYAGRNGHAYTSIGRILIESGALAERDMSLAALKAWLRQAGLNDGEPGAELLERNESFVFFAIDDRLPDNAGPVGGAGLPLVPLLSIAIDRTLFPYGLPFVIEANLPWRSSQSEPFAKLMLAQDTGSAIVGPARADIFFGTGAAAGVLAGNIRHPARFSVLLPKDLA